MGYPRAVYNNLVEAATITSIDEDSGYPDDNAADWRDFLRWHDSGANSYWIKADLGSSQAATSLALSGHNLNTVGARYKLEGSNNDADWSSVVSYTTPSDNKTRVDFFTSVSYRYWRLTIDNNGGANFDLELGLFFVGTYLEFPEHVETGFDPDRQKIKSNWDTSENGNILACAVDYRLRPIRATFKWLTRTWVSNTWLPFWESVYSKPFIWVWDHEDHGDEAYLVRFDMKEMTVPYDVFFRSPLNLSMLGLLEE